MNFWQLKNYSLFGEFPFVWFFSWHSASLKFLLILFNIFVILLSKEFLSFWVYFNRFHTERSDTCFWASFNIINLFISLANHSLLLDFPLQVKDNHFKLWLNFLFFTVFPIFDSVCGRLCLWGLNVILVILRVDILKRVLIILFIHLFLL